MQIELNKKYKTRDGNAVEIYKIDAGGTYPVIGAVLNPKTKHWECWRWTINGDYSEINALDNTKRNLVEVPNFETVEYVSGYANTVNYFGMRVAVPDGILWLATDQDGTLFGYFTEPYIRLILGDGLGYWDTSMSVNLKFANITFNGDWKQSKMKVKTDK